MNRGVCITEQNKIRLDNAIYCVQRSYVGENSVAEIIAKRILDSQEMSRKIDVQDKKRYNIDGKLVLGGKI